MSIEIPEAPYHNEGINDEVTTRQPNPFAGYAILNKPSGCVKSLWFQI